MAKDTKARKAKQGISIIVNININSHINIGNHNNLSKEFRAEGGSQIIKNVKANANQGGQNAIKGSRSSNQKTNFANGNGRSGIAGKKNKEKNQ